MPAFDLDSDDKITGGYHDTESKSKTEQQLSTKIERAKEPEMQPVSSIGTTYECWKLTKAPSQGKDRPNWKRAERFRLSLPSDELAQEAKRHCKTKSVTEGYDALSPDQRAHVEALVEKIRQDERDPNAEWELADIYRKLRDNYKLKVRETTYIRLILRRGQVVVHHGMAGQGAAVTQTIGGSSLSSKREAFPRLHQISPSAPDEAASSSTWFPPDLDGYPASAPPRHLIRESYKICVPEPTGLEANETDSPSYQDTSAIPPRALAPPSPPLWHRPNPTRALTPHLTPTFTLRPNPMDPKADSPIRTSITGYTQNPNPTDFEALSTNTTIPSSPSSHIYGTTPRRHESGISGLRSNASLQESAYEFTSLQSDASSHHPAYEATSLRTNVHSHNSAFRSPTLSPTSPLISPGVPSTTILGRGVLGREAEAARSEGKKPTTAIVAGDDGEIGALTRKENPLTWRDRVGIPKQTSRFISEVLVWLGWVPVPLTPERVRVVWENRVGQRYSSDIRQLRDRGIADLFNNLERSVGAKIVSVKNAQGATTTSNSWRSFSTTLGKKSSEWAGMLNTKKSKAAALPQHNLPAVTPSNQRLPFSHTQADDILMICMQRERHSKKLFQESLYGHSVDSDQALFFFLQKMFSTHHRHRRILQSLVSVRKADPKLVQFMLPMNNRPFLPYQSCPSSAGNQCKCLPPDDKINPPPQEYRCTPPGTCPPVPIEVLKDYFRNPTILDPKEIWLLSLMPKRICGTLSGKSTQPAQGWGISFEEEWDFAKIGQILLVNFVGSLIFAIFWSVFRHDVQGGFGVSGYWVTSAYSVIPGLLLYCNV